MTHNCIKCGTPLVVGENVTQYMITNYQHICRTCNTKQAREWRHRPGQYQPMCENKQCSQYPGIHVAERVLSHVFKHVEKMPMNNAGFDFICGGGHKIDVKTGCRHHGKYGADRWLFHIGKNQIAEYFLCLAFDNRDDLKPEHVWRIPANEINDHVSISISETTCDKWDQYKLDVTKVSACCNIIRGE